MGLKLVNSINRGLNFPTIRLHSLESTSKPFVQSLNLNIDKAKPETTERPQAHTHQQNRRSVLRV